MSDMNLIIQRDRDSYQETGESGPVVFINDPGWIPLRKMREILAEMERMESIPHEYWPVTAEMPVFMTVPQPCPQNIGPADPAMCK